MRSLRVQMGVIRLDDDNLIEEKTYDLVVEENEKSMDELRKRIF